MHLGGCPGGSNNGGLRRREPTRKQQYREAPRKKTALAAVLRGGVNGPDIWVLLWGSSDGGPWRGPGARSTDEDALRTRAGLGGTPRPHRPQAPGPRAPPLTGAGVSAGRRPRRRRRRRRSGETRGPDRKCRPLPLPGRPAPPACLPARKRKLRSSPGRRRGEAEKEGYGGGGSGGDREEEVRLRADSGEQAGKA